METYYDILGVPESATEQEIIKAYRREAMKWHPDRNKGSSESHDRFKQIAAAYKTLIDPEQRRFYDDELNRYHQQERNQREQQHSSTQEEQSSWQQGSYDDQRAEQVFWEEMFDFAIELQKAGMNEIEIALNLARKGCPESIAIPLAKKVAAFTTNSSQFSTEDGYEKSRHNSKRTRRSNQTPYKDEDKGAYAGYSWNRFKELFALSVGKQKNLYYSNLAHGHADSKWKRIYKWNWAAAIFGVYWLIYRKVYVSAFFLIFILIGSTPPLLGAIMLPLLLLDDSLAYGLNKIVFFIWGISFCAFFTFGFLGNGTIVRHNIKKVKKARSVHDKRGIEPAREWLRERSGVSYVWPIIVFSILYIPFLFQSPDTNVAVKTAAGKFTMGETYYFGEIGVTSDFKKAREWYQKAVSQNHALAMVRLGDMLGNGEGGDKDPEGAMRWYKAAAKLNEPMSLVYVASYYGDTNTDSYNPDLFLEMLIKAADLGYIIAQRELCDHYIFNDDSDANFMTGKKYCELTIQNSGVYTSKHDSISLPLDSNLVKDEKAEAFTSLARQFYYGLGVPKNPGLAFDYSIKGAERDIGLAHHLLALMYEEGSGTEKDFELAKKSLQNAANHGFVDAKFNLGRYNYNGIGGKADEQTGLKLIREAANEGSDDAQYFLASIIYESFTSNMDLIVALAWAMIADNNNYYDKSELKTLSDSIESSLSDEDILSAIDLSKSGPTTMPN